MTYDARTTSACVRPHLAGVAGEGLDPEVQQRVLLERVGLGEGRAALHAHERVHARVRLHVRLHLTYAHTHTPHTYTR